MEDQPASMSALDAFKTFLMPLALVVDPLLMALTIYGGLATGCDFLDAVSSFVFSLC